MSKQPDIFVIGVGAMTPVGSSAAVAAASVHAGLSQLSIHPMEDGIECHLARVAAFEPGLQRTTRLERLLGCALAECGARSTMSADAGLWLAAPDDFDTSALPGTRFGNLICVSVSAVPAARGLVALERAVRALVAGEVELACVAGVDVRSDDDSLDKLQARGSLLTESSPWGIVPGEGAGAVLLALEPARRRLGLPALARVCGVTSGLEDTVARGAPNLAATLSSLCHQLLDGLPQGTLIDQIYADLNGERPRADEWSYTAARISPRCRDARRPTAPARYWGDMGLASGALSLQLAAGGLAHGVAHGRQALAWTADEAGGRAVVLLEAAQPHALRTPRRDAASAAATHDDSILDDVLAEASFLCMQRRTLREARELSPEAGSTASERNECRLERHIEALTMAAERSRELAATAISDPGAAYTFTRLCLATGRTDELLFALRDIDGAAASLEVSAALSHGALGEHAPLAQQLLTGAAGDAARAHGLALCGVLGVRPAQPWEALCRDLNEGGANVPRALGLLASPAEAPLLKPWLASEDDQERSAAALAFARLDRRNARALLLSRSDPTFLPVLALTCPSSERGSLVAHCELWPDEKHAALALGLLGTPAALQSLLARLQMPAAARSAARALLLATGVELLEERERVTVTPDDELSERELEARRAGDAEVGIEHDKVRAVVCDTDAWERVCAAHVARHQPGEPTRLGRPLSVASEAAVLVHPRLAPSLQQLCADNLSLSFGVAARLGSEPRLLTLRKIADQLMRT